MKYSSMSSNRFREDLILLFRLKSFIVKKVGRGLVNKQCLHGQHAEMRQTRAIKHTIYDLFTKVTFLFTILPLQAESIKVVSLKQL
jgi:hypothetical protein